MWASWVFPEPNSPKHSTIDDVSKPPPSSSSNDFEPIFIFSTLALFFNKSSPDSKPISSSFLAKFIIFLALASETPAASTNSPGLATAIAITLLYPESTSFSAVAAPTPGRS